MAATTPTPFSAGAGTSANAGVEERTQQIGLALFERMERYQPSPLEAAGDRAMQLLALDTRFRSRLLRFVDSLAGLGADRRGLHVQRLLREYLDADFPHLPAWLRATLPVLRSEVWPAPLVAAVARQVTKGFAARFIASGGADGALDALAYLRRYGRYPSFDVLGEYVASEKEADAYRDQYLALLRTLARSPEAGRRTIGGVMALQVSIKLSSLTADFNPIDPAGTLARVQPRLSQIIDAARGAGVGITIDMERFETRDLVQQIFFEVFGPGGEFPDWDGIGVVLQAYLRDAEQQSEALLAFARGRAAPFQVRLVKGAYWDYETVIAHENGWPAPVWEEKAETDATFERLSERLLDGYPHVRPAIASHNLRSHARAEALREARGLPVAALEHQTLFRTAEGTARALAAMGWPCRDYVPLGELLPGMAYLVRRILENSSQVGFLLQSRAGADVERLLAPPRPSGVTASSITGVAAITGVTAITASLGTSDGASLAAAGGFRNHPPRRLYLAVERDAFAAALEAIRGEFGREYPLELAGEVMRTSDVVPVLDPSHPDGEPLGRVHNAGEAEVKRALALVNGAAADWAARPVEARAGILRRAATLLAGRRDTEAAWIVHEAAKSWSEALADVDEAIDYLNFYAGEAERLAADWAGYRPRGVVAVIPPWNFPIAIPCGMTSAALVAGNAVILKPAEQTPLISRRLVTILHEAGVPRDALLWLPGRGEVAGAALVASSVVDMIAFTGSRAVGTLIYRQGSSVVPRRGGLRTSLVEMGGKNAIIVFPDADLDEAVVAILRSAFGHANQKCSAASRVLVHSSIYDRLRQRLVEGADSLPAGPADAAGTFITPLIDAEARERVRKAAAAASREGRVLLDDLTPSEQSSAYRPLLVEISSQRAATASVAQEEIFGPVLVLIPFRDEAEALRLANGTTYALTGGVFSRSPGTVARMMAAFDAGNLYINRPITGARVGVEPFGGHKLSGSGPKAGGSDYLWAFVTRRAGYRPGGNLLSGEVPLPPGSLQPWHEPAARRRERMAAALELLRGEMRELWQNAFPTSDPDEPLAAAEQLLERLYEIATPQTTVPLPGQQTVVRWDTPRGRGLVVTDAGTSTADLLVLIAAPLLTGNGISVLPDLRHRPAAAIFIEALWRSGVPHESVFLAEEGLDLANASSQPEITFAAADLAEDAARTLYGLLANASATPDSPHLKALLTLADGPAPHQPGFLQRFALPKTVAIRTLHLGAELELLDMTGE